MSPYCQPSTNQQSNNARSSGARSRPAVFTRRDYIVVATDRANDLKIRWVHSPHFCRTLAHRVVRVGRLLQTRPKVSGVVCHRDYCPGLLTHGYAHPSIGYCGYIQPQDSYLRLIRRHVSLASRPVPAPKIPGTARKPYGKPRKYQSRPSSWAATASGEDGDSNDSCLAGGGDYGSGIGKGDWDVDTRCDEDSPPRSATRNNTPTRLRFNHIAPNTRVRSPRAKRRSTLPWRCWTASLWLESSAGHHQL